MAGMFSSPKVPKPEPLPPSPILEEEKMRQRDAASSAAAMDLAVGGRRSTVHAGSEIAMAEQQKRVKRRVAEVY